MRANSRIWLSAFHLYGPFSFGLKEGFSFSSFPLVHQSYWDVIVLMRTPGLDTKACVFPWCLGAGPLVRRM